MYRCSYYQHYTYPRRSILYSLFALKGYLRELFDYPILRMIAPRDLPLYYPNPAIYTLGKRRKEKKRNMHALSLIEVEQSQQTRTEREERKEKRN